MKKTFFARIISFLFPYTCVVCNKAPAFIHDACAEKLSPCNDHFVSWLQALWSYRDPRVKKIIRHLKNRIDDETIIIIARRIASTIPRGSVIVSIPSSKSRIARYGFNQSHTLARAVASCVSGSLYSQKLLVRTFESSKQALKSRQERIDSLKNIFAAHPGEVTRAADHLRGASHGHGPPPALYLIDDVTTTGATLFEARSSILKVDATLEIRACTIAH